MTTEKITSTRELYAKLSRLLMAIEACEASNNTEWKANHTKAIRELVYEYMPNGSGFDSGTSLDISASNPEKLVFETNVHHMNEGGFYDGWTSHKVIVTPSLAFGFDVKVTGRDRNDIKNYIGEMFSTLI